MKYAKVAKADSVESRPVRPEDFIESEAKVDSMKKISKKEIRKIAKKMGLSYDEPQVAFTQKIIAYWMKNV